MILKNKTEAGVKVMGGIVIEASSEYKVEPSLLVNFSCDVCLRVAVAQEKIIVSIHGLELSASDARLWLNDYADGRILPS